MLWSPYQEAIFTDFRQGVGHTVVVACAGSGKTTTILHGLDHLPQARILFCAFGHDIAKELRGRAPSRVDVMTLHRLGLTAINHNPYYRRADINEDKDFALAMASVTGTRWLAQEPSAPSMVKKAAALAKNLLIKSRDELIETIKLFGLDTDLFPAEELAACTADAVRMAIDDKKRISFDDMVWLPVILGMPVPQYDYVLVDELQDVCLSQLRLAQAACAPGGRIIGVGDPNQAIYGFRGADKDAVNRVITELKAKTLPLSVSYRCAKKIVWEAKAFVPTIEAAPEAPLGEVIDGELNDMLLSVVPGDFILSRANAPLSSLCHNLVQNNVPARIMGRSDVTHGLDRLIKRSKAHTAMELRGWLETFREKERERLSQRPATFDAVEDVIDTLLGFTDDADSVGSVRRRIDQLFVDKLNQDAHVTLATTHKAKGKERNRVFLLEETYMRRPGPEETNLMYVGITRAKRILCYVNGLYDKKKDPQPKRAVQGSFGFKGPPLL